MAKQYVTDSGVLKIPGAYAKYKVQSSPGGLATTGVLMLVGEAESGPAWTAEEDLETNAFGPDSLAEVTAKYKSGPLVDAFRGAIAASNDPDIVGSFSRAILVKTNAGQKASAALSRLGSGSYTTVFDRSFGSNGNQISMAAAASTSEVLPTTGSFTYIPAVGIISFGVRTNGGAVTSKSLAANASPTAFVTELNEVSGITATGGVNRGIVTVSGTLAISLGVEANSITLTRSVAWAVAPVVGDTLVIPSSAPALLRDPAGGTTDDNVGAYLITAVGADTLTAVKLSNAGRTGSNVGDAVVPPVATAAPVSIAAITDAAAFSPVAISISSGLVIPGRGKSLELIELAVGTTAETIVSTDLLSRTAFNLGTTTAVSWVSKSTAPKLIVSGAESAMTLTASRALDSISESFTAGGEIALKLGFTGSDVTVTITETNLTASNGMDLTLSDYATIQALADYIAAQPGWTASVGTAALGFLPPTALDRISAQGVTSQFGTVQPLRIKIDAHRMFTAVSEGSSLLQFGNPATRPDAGLPAVTSTTFLSGGARGATTSQNIVDAIAALEAVEGNFLVPLFSRDASLDAADGLTDGNSDYTIAGVNAAARAHVLSMSQFKRRKSRQAISSIQAAFADQQSAAANTATHRVNMTFQNVKDLNSNGDIVTFQPWMAAVKAAAMQSAGFYRSITNKKVAVSGVVHAAGDFNSKLDSHVENALTAGLMPLRASRTGGFSWVSDQTTYGQDANFVFNSLQAVYAADIIALATGQRMEQAFVGQSVADVNAQVALTYLDQIMADFMRLKLIAPSDDAKKGYKNASIRISGNVMLVSVEIKLATAIDFVVISFLVSPVEQTA